MKNKTLLLLVVILLNKIILFAQDGIKPIIDVHLHDYPEEQYRSLGPMSPKTYKEYKEETMKMLKKYNVVKAVVSTIGGDNILDDEGILYPGYFTSTPPKDTLEFKRKIKAGEIKVFGEIGAVYAGFTLSDPGFDPYLAICEKFDVPVGIHTGGGPPNPANRGNTTFRLSLGHPYTIEDVIAKYPKLRIYLMHAGEVYHEEAIRLMLQYTNVYADLGVVLWINDYVMDYGEAFLRKAKKYDLLDRVMFGSDQMVWPHAIEKSIQKLDSFDFLNEEDKRKIFYENAVNFLKLTEEDLKGY